ncbi:SAM50 [Candida jiufengensis]|uniref:SAM50 n=1 Tax=Candida jiufengensis TaxID=497108 RepID=UPI002225038A|nr:SAM50 [Candida jiufengensis]KAI5952682.1 SAM50 [Candida jiufengensis]
MSVFSQDEEFMDNMKKQPPAPTTDQTKAEKELSNLQSQKQQQLIDQNQNFLKDLFHDNATQPIRIKNVQLTNGEQYRDSFLVEQFKPLMTGEVLSLTNYLETIDSISKNFLKLGIVENILCNTHQINQQTKPNFGFGVKPTTTNQSAINVVPVFNVIPIKKFLAKTGTNIGNGEGDGYIQFQLRNILGGAENLTFDAVTGSRTSSSFLVNYNQPVNNDADYIWDNSFSINTRKLDWIQSNLHSKSIINKIYTQYNNSFLNHEIILENSLKNLDNYGSKSFAVMKQCGEQLKTSIAYNLIYDSRDNKHLPFKGTLCQLGIEYNGLFKFNKNPYFKIAQLSQTAYALPWINSHLLYTNKCGLLYSLAKNGETSILDRFYIGGPNDVRGFTLNGLGPKDKNSYLGGDLFSVGGVSLFIDIPYYKESNFKFHNFLNWGKIVTYNKNQSFYDNLKKLGGSYCVSCGFGILYNHPMARFELNFVLPLVANEKDNIRKGIQYGIGVSFL